MMDAILIAAATQPTSQPAVPAFLFDAAFWVGFYGAALSTVLGIVQLRASRRHVVVTCSQDVILGGQLAGKRVVSVTAVNHGTRPVVIRSMGIRLTSGETAFPSDILLGRTELPKTLADGESATISFPNEHLAKIIASGAQPSACVALDTTGRVHRGKIPRDLLKNI